jgi:ribulose 1,5-bisphosphate synthetase/thiazole synthase
VFTPPRNGSFAPVAAGAAALLLEEAADTADVLVTATAVEVENRVVDEITVETTLVLDDTGAAALLLADPTRHWE